MDKAEKAVGKVQSSKSVAAQGIEAVASKIDGVTNWEVTLNGDLIVAASWNGEFETSFLGDKKHPIFKAAKARIDEKIENIKFRRPLSI